jgi:hypothetical protein
MKYILILGTGTVVIGFLLTICVEHFFGHWFSSLLVEFVAVPIGFFISLFFFVVYDQIWPKQNESETNRHKNNKDKS